MTVDPSRHFACETYLLAFAAGAREGFIREHVDRCLFCHDIVHGGSDEFPLSYDEEVALAKTENRRAARRRFLKVGAAAVVGLSLMGGTGLVASRLFFHPTQVIEHQRKKSLDKIYAIGGRPALIAMLQGASEEVHNDLHIWIVERNHVQLVDLIVADLQQESSSLRASAVIELRKIAPTVLTPHKTAIQSARAYETDDGILMALDALILTIP